MSYPPRRPSHGHSTAAHSNVNGDLVLQAAKSAGITDPKELANFMGQMQVESAGFTRMHENLNYRSERLLEKFQGRNGMNTLEQAQTIVKDGPQKIAETIYGGEWGKRSGGPGNTEPGDGWIFHGRGFVQLTGRYNYERYGKALGLDLVNHPDLAAEPANAAKIAVQYWKETVAKRGHQTDITLATEDINGGHNGLKERKAAAAHWETKLALGYKPGDPEPGQSLQDSPLYKQAHAAIQNIDARFCRKPDRLTDNAAAVVAVATHRAGFTRIDHLELGGPDNSKIIAVQGKVGTAHSKIVDVPTVEAMHTPIAQSAKAFAAAQQAGQHAPTQHLEPAVHQSKQQAAPALSR